MPDLRIENRLDDADEPTSASGGEFVLLDGDKLAGEMSWHWTSCPDHPRVLDITHTGVRAAYGGSGWARELVMAGVEFAKEQGVTILPHCSYARSVLRQDPELAKLLVPGWKDLL